MKTEREKMVEHLTRLRLGVYLDRHNSPSAQDELNALDAAIAALSQPVAQQGSAEAGARYRFVDGSSADVVMIENDEWEWVKYPTPTDPAVLRYAERYRWLRDYALHHEEIDRGTPYAVYGLGMGDAEPCWGSELDAMCDHSMSQDPSWLSRAAIATQAKGE